jgi:hypothetical protein
LRLSEPATGVFSAMPVQKIHMHEKKSGTRGKATKKVGRKTSKEK